MNYRHIYHAGNFADVTKHLALCLILDHLKKKDSPFCVIDAHGGIGLYDLQSDQAQKTREWESGIGRFEGAEAGEDFALYHDLVKDDLAQNLYPGSPLLIARMLRDQDRLIANELHPDDVVSLEDNLNRQHNTRVTRLDAYECIRANIPPKEKRGLVLIDPPFEKRDEFETLARQMGEWKKRFAAGIFMIWYPIKAHLAIQSLKQAAASLGINRTWCIETLLHPGNQPETFNGSGLLIFNTPYMLPERMEALLPFLKERMGLFVIETGWLAAG
jgi:23S rRNA (adenine2030-N6)-methyltransferase